MVPVMSLWLPIILSAVVVFVASSVIHMVLFFYHRDDYAKLPDEDGIMDALRKFNIPPGDYLFPKCDSPKEMKEPAFKAKWNRGPVGIVTVMPGGPPAMGKSLASWFLYCVVVGIFAAYIAGRALKPGDPYLSVFRFAGCTAFLGYSLALWQQTIWYHRSWISTLKYNVDGLVFALLTGGVFGWLWPK